MNQSLLVPSLHRFIRDFVKHPSCIAPIKPFIFQNKKNADYIIYKPWSQQEFFSLHLHKALLKFWLRQMYIGPQCPNSKCTVFIFPPACAELRPLMHIHAICTTPKWIMRQEAPNRIVMACMWEGSHHAHVCAARVLNQKLWHNECGFYIIILNKPMARHYKKKTLTQWVALGNETIIKIWLNVVTGNHVHILEWKKQTV